MDRRNFFKAAISRVSEKAIAHAEQKVSRQAARWVRPPFALPELEFLLTCTRCGECSSACPYQIVFPLGAHNGSRFAGTPALDLLNKGCHLCKDWPCVNSCKTGALIFPATADREPLPIPALAEASVDTATCLPYLGPECGACAGSCPIPGALLWDLQKPHIDPEVCIGCGLCREACILDPQAIRIKSLTKPENDGLMRGTPVTTE